MSPVLRSGSFSSVRSRKLAVGTGVARDGGGTLGASEGDGEGDKEPFLRLRRRAERSDSGVGCLEVVSKMGLGLSIA